MQNTYQIIDCHTGAVVGQATNLRAASRKAERLNQAYGAVRYSYRFHPNVGTE